MKLYTKHAILIAIAGMATPIQGATTPREEYPYTELVFPPATQSYNRAVAQRETAPLIISQEIAIANPEITTLILTQSHENRQLVTKQQYQLDLKDRESQDSRERHNKNGRSKNKVYT